MYLEASSFKNDAGSLSIDQIRPLKLAMGLDVFIETGTYLGETAAAMREIFSKVVTIELSNELHMAASDRFKNDKGVVLLKGDSGACLIDALQESSGKSSLIWLDAHSSGGITAKSDKNTPILDELLVIEEASLGRNVILIDDIRLFVDLPHGFAIHDSHEGYPKLSLIVEILAQMTEKYKVFIVGDILVAIPDLLLNYIEVSAVVSAMTQLRYSSDNNETTRYYENVVSNATGSERNTIMSLPICYADSLNYGIGGHFCYWRGLIHEKESNFTEAANDFRLARKCGVSVRSRSWE